MGDDGRRGCARCNALLAVDTELCAYCAAVHPAPAPRATRVGGRPRSTMAIAVGAALGVAATVGVAVVLAVSGGGGETAAGTAAGTATGTAAGTATGTAAGTATGTGGEGETAELGAVAEAGETAEAPGPDPGLPETPDRQRVLRRLRRLDASRCRGDFAITFTVVVRPDGTVGAPTLGPLRANNTDLSCVRGLFDGLRFARSQRGLTVRHELRGGSFK